MDEERRGPPEKESGKHGSETDPQLSLWQSEPAPLPEPTRAPAATAPVFRTPGEFALPEDAIPPASVIPPSIDPPWSIQDLTAFVVFAFLSFIFANLVEASIFSLLRRSFHWNLTMEQALMQAPWVVSMQTAWELLWLLFIYFTVSRKYHLRFWEALKWVRAPWPPIAYLITGAVLALGAEFVFNLFPSQKHLPVEKLFSNAQSAYLLAFFGICVAPFVEEMVFRGFFYPVFERLWGLAAAVLLTSLLFAAIHIPQLSGGWEEIASIFVVGAVLSYCRGKTGSLKASFLMHVAYNTSLFVSLYISTNRFQNLKG